MFTIIHQRNQHTANVERQLQAVAEGVRLLPQAEREGFVARFNARAASAAARTRR